MIRLDPGDLEVDHREVEVHALVVDGCRCWGRIVVPAHAVDTDVYDYSIGGPHTAPVRVACGLYPRECTILLHREGEESAEDPAVLAWTDEQRHEIVSAIWDALSEDQRCRI